jgi:hypothetical protein
MAERLTLEGIVRTSPGRLHRPPLPAFTWLDRGNLGAGISVSVDVDMPIVSMFYDGNGGQNRRLEVFLNNAVSGKRQTGDTQIGGDFQPGWTGKDRLVPVEHLTSRIRTGGNAGESAQQAPARL